MRPAGVTDSAKAIAREMVEQIGRAPAVGYLLGKALGASSWRRVLQALKLAVAVLFAPSR